ncbi:hypothetical protein [Chryseobacterium sp. RU37D]|uniref:hypothetical protein n=1 Tax=Chryseobacterium sp. RU37D TaxID=1907397 RepID=UPI000970A40E|nr:hypothetical protein [Chryseobacterium sp. RU37D]
MKNEIKPNYRRIYSDIIEIKFHDKKRDFDHLLKENMTALEIMELDRTLFGEIEDQDTEIFNQSHRSYDKNTILKILNYQKEYNLNNSQLSNQFKISRTTITKWKKFLKFI